MNRRLKVDKAASAPGLLVRVTDRHIKDAERCHGGRCMIAEAIVDAYPDATYVQVDLQAIRFTDLTKGLRYTYFTPQKAQLRLLAFDRGKHIDPFTFRISDTDAKVRISGWKGQGRAVNAPRRRTTTHAQCSVATRYMPPPQRREFGLCIYSDTRSATR